MRCPSCRHENEAKAKACAGCGAALKPKRRPRRGDDEPPSPQAEAYNREAASLYIWCVVAMLPLAGLVLGPIVAVRARRILIKGTEAALPGVTPVGLAFWMGVISATLSWVGLALVVLGLLWR